MKPARSVAEVLLIAVGVLLGLSADAWLESRGERRLEAYYLEALGTEIEANVTWLSETIEQHEERRRAGAAMIERHLADPEGASVPLDDFVRLFGFRAFNPVTATVDQLVASGDLSLLRSEGLRSALAQWSSDAHAAADYLDEDQWGNWNFVSQPFLQEHVGLPASLSTLRRHMGVEFGFEAPAELLFVSAQVANVIAARINIMSDVVAVATELRSRAEGVAVQLGAAR